MVQKVRAAFTTWNERIKPGDVIETSDKQHHKVCQILLINENLVILETNQYRERILNNSLARVNPVYGELCGSRSYIPVSAFIRKRTLKVEGNEYILLSQRKKKCH